VVPVTPQHSTRKPERGLRLRKAPGQSRSVHTVSAILEGAAHILETHGFDRYSTNSIAARAGVSIGSLYQYFPNKDAVTIVLIERESAALAARVRKALVLPEWIDALRALIVVAVNHQLRHPNLARLLDLEEDRLAAILSPFQSRLAVRDSIAEFLAKKPDGAPPDCLQAAGDVIAIVGALTDAAGRRGDKDPGILGANVEKAVLGYLVRPGAAAAGSNGTSRANYSLPLFRDAAGSFRSAPPRIRIGS
jgi:AcrR family transcriptional regulator